MQAKKYLEEVERLNIIIEQQYEEVSKLRQLLYGTGSLDYEHDRVTGGKLPGTIGLPEKVAKVNVAEKELDAMIDEYNNFRKGVIWRIRKVHNKLYVKCLYKRYIEGKALRSIAVDINRSYDYTRALNSDALASFEKIHKKFLENLTLSYKIPQFNTESPLDSVV